MLPLVSCGLLLQNHFLKTLGNMSSSYVCEFFPKKCIFFSSRTTFIGLCSGMARLGAIIGIVVVEIETSIVGRCASVLGLIVCILPLIPYLPDLTKQKMPKTFKQMFHDLHKVKMDRFELSNTSPSPSESITETFA